MILMRATAFDALSVDNNQEYFSDWLVEKLIIVNLVYFSFKKKDNRIS